MGCLGNTLSIVFMLLSFIGMCLCGAVAGFGMFYYASSTSQMAAFGLGTVGMVLAISGGAMFMIKFLGLCGAAMESYILTKLFYIVLCVGLALQGAIGVVTLVTEAKVESGTESAWYKATEVTREIIQKRNLCCGFHSLTEDSRCSRLYTEACGERLIRAQSTSLKLVSALIFLATMFDVFLLVIAIFLARFYARMEQREKEEHDAKQKILRSNPLKA